MEKDDGSGRFPHGKTEHFTRMHNAERQAAFRYGRIPHDRVFRIQQDDLENLMAEISETGMVVMKEITARCDLCALGQWGSERTLAEFERSFQLRRLCRSDSRNGTELFDSAMSESRKSVEPVEHFKTDLHRRGSLATDPKQNGQKLRVSQRSWPLCEQPFAWTFAFRPLGNPPALFPGNHHGLTRTNFDSSNVFVLAIGVPRTPF
jgi:hypothetical protein